MNKKIQQWPTGRLWLGLGFFLLMFSVYIFVLALGGGPVDTFFLVLLFFALYCLAWAYRFSNVIWRNHRAEDQREK